MPSSGKRVAQAATPDSLSVSVEQEKKGQKRGRDAEANNPEESAAASRRDIFCAANSSKVVPSTIREELVSAKGLPSESLQHVPDNCDDIGVHQVTAGSSAEGGLGLPKASKEENESCDISTFPISCSLKLHDQGFYILSGVCRLCGQEFRAESSVLNGVVIHWKSHASVQKDIIQHARTHGAVGYTPHWNLDKMRVDWTRTQDDTSSGMPRSGKRQKGVQLGRSLRLCSKCGVYRVSDAFRWTTEGRVDVCRSCELVP